ncbi:MAG: hypothetical protein ABFC77_14915 [Thermoguttaceae bacterium]
MKRRRVLGTISCLWVAGLVTFVAYRAVAAVVSQTVAAEREPSGAVSQWEQLQDRVAKLESRVAALEKRPAYVTVPTNHYNAIPKQKVPSTWSEQEFNGSKYYMVPLESQRTK